MIINLSFVTRISWTSVILSWKFILVIILLEGRFRQKWKDLPSVGSLPKLPQQPRGAKAKTEGRRQRFLPNYPHGYRDHSVAFPDHKPRAVSEIKQPVFKWVPNIMLLPQAGASPIDGASMDCSNSSTFLLVQRLKSVTSYFYRGVTLTPLWRVLCCLSRTGPTLSTFTLITE